MNCRNCGREIVKQEEWGDEWWEHIGWPLYRCHDHRNSPAPEPLTDNDIIDKLLAKYESNL